MELTKDLLKERFKEYNAAYFNNELKMCKFSLYHTSYELGQYTLGSIWIAKRPKNAGKQVWDEEMFKETFVHEMVHHYVCTVKGKKSFLFPHGLRFRRKSWEIKRKYGLNMLNIVYIKRYATLTRKQNLSIWNKLEFLYLKPWNYFLTWIF